MLDIGYWKRINCVGTPACRNIFVSTKDRYFGMELNKIHCSDNLDILRELGKTNHRFDLCLTDPPYNVGKDFGNDSDKQSVEAYASHITGRVNYLSEVLNPHASVLWFCSHRYLQQTMYTFQPHGLSTGFYHYQRLMIWYYRNGLSRQTKSPVTEYEPFLWFTKHPEIYTYNADDVRVPYRSERVKNPVYKKDKNGNKVAWMPDPRGAKRGDVWEYPALAGKNFEDERTDHPTQKPEALFMDLIKAFCPKAPDGRYEGKVLDIYSGSGTTAVCCEKLNQAGHRIEWLAVELNPYWVEIANKRLDAIRDAFIL